MNLSTFEVNNYCALKDHAIDNYLCDVDDFTLFLDSIHMVETFRIKLQDAYIDVRMPENKMKEIVHIMKPYLRDFLIGVKSHNPLKKEIARSSAVNGLVYFFGRYPGFGTLQYHNVTLNDSSNAGEIEDDIEMLDDDL